jgi:hypothetical protein
MRRKSQEIISSRPLMYAFLKEFRIKVQLPSHDRRGVPVGLRPTDGNKEALFVGRAPLACGRRPRRPGRGYQKPPADSLQWSGHKLRR